MIEIIVDAGSIWEDAENWQNLAEQAVHSALSQISDNPIKADRVISVSIKLSDNEEVHALNKQWRGKDKPTNVLSFPMMDGAEIDALLAGGGIAPNDPSDEIMVGDIILAHETCIEEAKDKAITPAQHVTHLIVHGMLHLLGHDHIDTEDAEIMEALEIKALASMGLPNPYS